MQYLKHLAYMVLGRSNELFISKEAKLKLAESLTELASKLFFIPLSHIIAELYVGLDTHWATYIISCGCLLLALVIKVHALNLIDLACAEARITPAKR